MSKIVNIESARRTFDSEKIKTDNLRFLLADLKTSIDRMNKIDEELMVTQRKLAAAQKRAQWAKRSIENLRALCINYIKTECQLDKVQTKKT
ncbi:hypothetical protein A9Q99_04010 [Gammaproteobacteria bacterium 45_16_T64]|nr:hypothetical protein A9Q99_04010 [Gammaproteobacteria bacterium 45_16_T64]